MENAIGAIWGQPEAFRALDHGDNIYHIFFAEEVDALRIELGSPWLFKNYILHVRRWIERLRVDQEDFSRFLVWVQLWRLPEFCKTKELGAKIGVRLGEVQEVDFFNVRGKEIIILKVKVEIDASKFLKSQLKLAGSDKKPMEVSFKYERIGCLCFYCGHLGHKAKACHVFLEDKLAGKQRADKLGPWVKEEQVGRRLEENRENKNPNAQGDKWRVEKRSKQPTPVSLLKSFSNLVVSRMPNKALESIILERRLRPFANVKTKWTL